MSAEVRFGGDPFSAGYQPKTVEYFLKSSDPEIWRRCTDEEELANYRKAKAIKDERKRIADEQIAHQRANETKQAQERIQYSDELAQEIVERIASGELLTVMCTEPSMPTARMVTLWLKQHDDFALLYNEALQDRLAIFSEQIIEFADKLPKEVQTITAKSTREKIQFPDLVQKAKLQIEVRFRHLKAFKPERWGEQSTLNVKDGADFSNMSNEDLEKKLADLDIKERINGRGAA